MKKFIATFAILIATISFCNTTQAQKVNVNINIGSQPAWGPVGYDYAGYYYFPDIDVYYNVNSGYYNYYDRGAWVSAQYLPYAYSSYDLYGLYKVVLNVNSPWLYNTNHRRDYARYRGYRGQYVIRDSRDARYYNSRNNRVQWYSANHRSDRRNDRYNYNGRNNNYYNRNDREPNRHNNNNNNKPNNNANSIPSYNNTRPNNQIKPNNRSQRNESANRNNRSENTRSRTNSSYTSINYSDNQTRSTTGRSR